MRVLFFLAFLLLPIISKAANFNDCLSCHKGIEQMPPPHNFSCQSCHVLPKDRNKPLTSHNMIIKNPSAPKYWNTFCYKCHAKQIDDVEHSLHYTAYGEINKTLLTLLHKKTNYTVQDLPSKGKNTLETLSFQFLRENCLKCHISTEGEKGTGLYRPSGCAACHMPLSKDGIYLGKDKAMHGKPSNIAYHSFIKPQMQNCLSCHNKQYVGTDYLGMFPKEFGETYRTPINKEGNFPPVIYGIDYDYLAKDVHYKAHMTCMSCHTKQEVMGNGKFYHNETQSLQVSCQTCHGGYHTKPTRYFKNIKLFNPNIPGHKYHENVSCSACHAQWTIYDFGFYALKDDTKDYTKWSAFTLTGNPQADKFLSNAIGLMEEGKTPPPPMQEDFLTGKLVPGLWHIGYLFTRWEYVILGKMGSKYVILRPMYQYYFSYKNAQGKVIVNNKFMGTDWEPYFPHTIGKARSCLFCHGNKTVAGDGFYPLKDNYATNLMRPTTCAQSNVRVLNNKEKENLINYTPLFKKEYLRHLNYYKK